MALATSSNEITSAKIEHAPSMLLCSMLRRQPDVPTWTRLSSPTIATAIAIAIGNIAT